MSFLLQRFQQLPDYRKCKQRKFNVGETLFMSLLALLAGANGYVDMEIWIKSKKKELTKLLGHPFIAPADNTIRNVFLHIDLDALNALFEDWSHAIARNKNTQNLNIVSSDGKTMRGSANKIRNEKARHIVSLFLSQEKITLAQIQIEDKSNEIPALLELLDSLKLDNCVITVDAMHTQKKL
jgi:predicted transposase YbfD/YdcC